MFTRMLRRRAKEERSSPHPDGLALSPRSSEAKQVKTREWYSMLGSLALLAVLAACMERLAVVSDRALHEVQKTQADAQSTMDAAASLDGTATHSLSDYHDVCVVGAGLSGAVIAERYAQEQGASVLILERRDHIAGNCFDYVDPETNIRVSKYGAHLFHTYYDRVWEYVQRFSEWTPYEHKVVALVNGRHVPVPVNIDTVNALFDLNIQTPVEMDEWLKKEQVQYTTAPSNSEEMALSRVGKRLYEYIFHPYTIKQWAKEPRDLGPEVTARIPVRNNHDARYFSDPHQALPTHGYTKLFENMLMKNPLIHVKLNTDFFQVRSQLHCGKLYYTGPIDRYVADLGWDKLEYRSLDFEKKVVKKPPGGYFQPMGVVNHPNATSNYTRIVEYKHFLNQSSPHTILFYEHSKDGGEPYYPVPNPQNKALFSKYQAMAEQEVNVTFVGRLANYKYFNMDQTIENALTLFEQDTQTMDMIVNHCKEDISWVPLWMDALGVNHTYIYDKCGHPPFFPERPNIQVVELPNTGREGASWIHHMLRKDIRFASQNIFLQGNHETSLQQLQDALVDIRRQQDFVDFVDFSRHPKRSRFVKGCFTDDGLCARYFDPREICEFHQRFASTGHDCHDAIATVRGEFYVSEQAMKRYVSSHGKKLESLAQELNKENNPILGHYLERCWGEIFGGYRGKVLLLDRHINDWREQIFASFRRFYRFCADDMGSCHLNH